MSQLIQAIRGMNDILPTETPQWHTLEAIIQSSFEQYGYQEIRTPLVEKTELFKRSIGEVTDIVEKEMYTFADRNGDSLTLRPEGTACCVRAGIEHSLFYNQVQRLWYKGAYFRHERPQKGRYRQFHQMAAEVFGLTGPDIDAELIALSATILQRLQLAPFVRLEINSLGNLEERQRYRHALVEYYQQHYQDLDEDSKRRLETNPLRILDSKNPALAAINQAAPKLIDYFDEESRTHFAGLQTFLTALNIPYTINPCLVRGLDYYNHCVFEWVTDALGAQGTVCAGGRYDGLVAQLGGKPTPALGFALGLERLLLMRQQLNLSPTAHLSSLYILAEGEAEQLAALQLAQQLRHDLPNWQIIQHCGGGSLKNQFKKADKSPAHYAIIIGADELAQNEVSIKSLRDNQLNQTRVSQNTISDFLKQLCTA